MPRTSAGIGFTLFAFLAVIVISPLAAADNKTGSGDSAGPAYLLRYKFQPDELLHYEVDHETTMVTSANHLTETVNNEVHSQKSQRVVDLDAKGNATLELAIERATMSARFDDGKALNFDSRRPGESSPYYNHIKPIIGKPLARVQVSPRGELLGTRPRLPHDVLAKANLVKADGSLSDDASQNFLIEFPEEALKVGEGWTNTFKVKVQVSRTLSQNMTFQRGYELVEVRDQIATIKMWTDLITRTSDGVILAQLIQMSPAGEIEFDLEKGRIVSRTLKIDKTEVGVINGGGLMKATSKRVERLVEPKDEESNAAAAEK